MAKWSSIETAPKDGTWIEAWRGPVTLGRWAPRLIVRWHQWEDGEAAWVWPEDDFDPYTAEGREDADNDIENGDYYLSLEFTHWMPLLDPPHDDPINLAGSGPLPISLRES